MERASCRGTDPEKFYPGRGQNKQAQAVIAQYCKRCPVRKKCLNHALEHNEEMGVWGEATAAQRIRIRRGEGVANR